MIDVEAITMLARCTVTDDISPETDYYYYDKLPTEVKNKIMYSKAELSCVKIYHTFKTLYIKNKSNLSKTTIMMVNLIDRMDRAI